MGSVVWAGGRRPARRRRAAAGVVAASSARGLLSQGWPGSRGTAAAPARSRRTAPRRRHGAGDDALRRRPAGLHDLQGAAHRGAAVADVAAPGEGDRLASRTSGSTSTGRRHVRIGGAVLANLRTGARAQGGSTITQQLARQSFLTLDKTYRRKLKEVILAADRARCTPRTRSSSCTSTRCTSATAHGVEAASLGFFGKHATDLTSPRPRCSPAWWSRRRAYAPTVNMERAHRARNVVLQAMVATASSTPAKPRRRESRAGRARDGLRRDEPHGPYFKEQVRRELVERFGWQRVYQGGLRVYTTIDWRCSRRPSADRGALDRSRAAPGARARKEQDTADDGPPSSAGRARGAGSADRRTCARWSAAATSARAASTAPSRRSGSPARRSSRSCTPRRSKRATRRRRSSIASTTRSRRSRASGCPRTSTRRAEMTLRTALRTSSNRAAVRLLQEVGIPKTVDDAKQLGVGAVPSVPSLALGSGEVTLEAMTAAYARSPTRHACRADADPPGRGPRRRGALRGARRRTRVVTERPRS